MRLSSVDLGKLEYGLFCRDVCVPVIACSEWTALRAKSCGPSELAFIPSTMKQLILAALMFFGSFGIASATPVNPNCTNLTANHIDCDLIPDSASGNQPIGVGVPPGSYVTFTNRTGAYLQVNEVIAITGEQATWSEFCVYLNDFVTGQNTPGRGEVGCTAKNIGENYPPIRWGTTTGLSVAPGSMVYLNSHTEPAAINHTYSLVVKPQTSGLYSWRAPKLDTVITCSGQQQSTPWTPWTNTTGGDLHLAGASIYSVSGVASNPNTVTGACVYVLRPDGSVRFSNCDSAARTRSGQLDFPTQVIQAGESVAGQAINTCPSGAVWDWAAFLLVW